MPDPVLTARHFETGRWVRLSTDGGVIASVEEVGGPAEISDHDDWIGPAFWDIQLNGRWGISFSDAALTEDQVAAIVRAQAGLGTARLCPTLITAHREPTLKALRTIAAARILISAN